MTTIFLHGLGQTSSSWNQTIKVMQKNPSILCPNLADFLTDKKTTYSNLYQSFSKYCASLKDPLNLCGLSLGGVLALQYTIENPDKVNSIVLIGTQYHMPKKLLQFQNILFHLMPAHAFQTLGFGKKDFIRLSQSMMDLNFQENLHQIHCPALILCGKKDKANKSASIQLKNSIPNAKLFFLTDAGHEVNLDAPEKLGRLLNTFFFEK